MRFEEISIERTERVREEARRLFKTISLEEEIRLLLYESIPPLREEFCFLSLSQDVKFNSNTELYFNFFFDSVQKAIRLYIQGNCIRACLYSNLLKVKFNFFRISWRNQKLSVNPPDI